MLLNLNNMIEKHQKQYFLSEEMLRNIFDEFLWPVPYVISKAGLAVNVEFDKCRICFSEGWEGRVVLDIFPDKHLRKGYSLTEALSVISPENRPVGWLKPLGLSEYASDVPSAERTIHMVRNICLQIQHYLLPSLSGDVGWVAELERVQEEFRKRFNA